MATVLDISLIHYFKLALFFLGGLSATSSLTGFFDEGSTLDATMGSCDMKDGVSSLSIVGVASRTPSTPINVPPVLDGAVQ
jgi:hypothetical protein